MSEKFRVKNTFNGVIQEKEYFSLDEAWSSILFQGHTLGGMIVIIDQWDNQVAPNRRRRVLTTYSVVTDESAEDGDYAEIGWLENGHKSPIRDEEGEHPENVHRDGFDCEVDSDEAEDGLSAMKRAAAYIQNEGGSEPSSSRFSPGTWYSTESQMDMYSGDYENKSFHLYGFTEEEEKEVWDLLHSDKRLRY